MAIVPIDKPGSSNGDQEAKKLHQMSSFAREFYDIDKPESSNGYQEDIKKFNKMGSFAREFYSSHGSGDEGDRLVEPDECGDAPRVARAKYRMAYTTDSQWAVLEQELGAEIGGGGGTVLEKVLAWRKKRGDFNYDDDDDDETGAFYGDVEVPQLPSDMKDVCETSLNLGFLKSDLQFECLLFNIPYAGSDSKPQLISKLMHHKDTQFLDANSFDILQRESITPTCRDDDGGGILNDAVKSDAVKSDVLGGDYLKDLQGVEDLEEEFMRAQVGEGKGGAGPSMVDAWRNKTGGFHSDDDDDDEDEDEEDYVDEDEDEADYVDDDEQEVFLSDEVPSQKVLKLK